MDGPPGSLIDMHRAKCGDCDFEFFSRGHSDGTRCPRCADNTLKNSCPAGCPGRSNPGAVEVMLWCPSSKKSAVFRCTCEACR